MSTQRSTTRTQSLEPRISSSLLSTRADGTQHFVHDNYKDFFLAHWFAEQIHSGNLSIQDAYIQFWSYEEDPELWGLDTNKIWRSILPSWRTAVSYFHDFLLPRYAKELENLVLSSFRMSEDTIDYGYNPFGDDQFILGIDYADDLITGTFGSYLPSGSGEKGPCLKDRLALEPSDVLVGMVRDDTEQSSIREDALYVLEKRHGFGITDDLLTLYDEMKRNKGTDVKLQSRICKMLLERRAISPEGFAQDFFSQRKSLSGIVSEEYDPFDSLVLMDTLPESDGIKAEVGKYLGRLIHASFEDASRADKVFYITCIRYLQHKDSGPLLIGVLDDYVEVRLGINVTDINHVALKAIGDISYTDAAPLLHQRLKDKIAELYSPKMQRMIKIHDEERRRHFEEEKDRYGEILSDGIVTKTSSKIDKVFYEIQDLINVLGKLHYEPVLSEFEYLIQTPHNYYEEFLFAQAIGDIGTRRAFDVLLSLRSSDVQRFYVADYHEALKNTVHSFEDFKRYMLLSREADDDHDEVITLHDLHNRFRPKGYTPLNKRITEQDDTNTPTTDQLVFTFY